MWTYIQAIVFLMLGGYCLGCALDLTCRPWMGDVK